MREGEGYFIRLTTHTKGTVHASVISASATVAMRHTPVRSAQTDTLWAVSGGRRRRSCMITAMAHIVA